MQGLLQLKNCWLNKKDSPALRWGGERGEGERENMSEYGGGCGGGNSMNLCYWGGPWDFDSEPERDERTLLNQSSIMR